MEQHDVRVISNVEIAPRHFHLVMQARAIARSAKPGQFVHVRTADRDVWDPLLRRPLSIFWTAKEQGRVALLYRVGPASRAFRRLSELAPGDELDVIGPLGEGVFRFDADGRPHPILVGGGVGIPPLYFLATRMAEAGARPDVFLGFADAESVLWVDEFRDVSRRVVVTTNDGSNGRKGFVTEPLAEWLDRPAAGAAGDGRVNGFRSEDGVGAVDGAGPPTPVADRASAPVSAGALGPVYACGPVPMMKAVRDVCRARGIPSLLSLEERMACGVGACLSCVARVADGQVEFIDGADVTDATVTAAAPRKRICVEGPVFPGEAVIFD